MESSSRWHDAVIALSIVVLLVVGIAAIWGDSIRALWLEQSGAGGDPEPAGADPQANGLLDPTRRDLVRFQAG